MDIFAQLMLGSLYDLANSSLAISTKLVLQTGQVLWLFDHPLIQWGWKMWPAPHFSSMISSPWWKYSRHTHHMICSMFSLIELPLLHSLRILPIALIVLNLCGPSYCLLFIFTGVLSPSMTFCNLRWCSLSWWRIGSIELYLCGLWALLFLLSRSIL